MMRTLALQIIWLVVLAIPIACISWTSTHEEVFREPRKYCRKQYDESHSFFRRKFFYALTCEFCFSHYITIFFLVITRYGLLYPDWRGYLVALFALVWIANQYMSVYNRLRLDIKHEGIEIAAKEGEMNDKKVT
jgi:hypothetical protein